MKQSKPTANADLSRSYAPVEKTSQTDDERIQDITVLPPPEHLIRFFPIAGTPVEGLITQTRGAIRHIMQGQDDRLLVIMGPCSIHDPAAALAYAHRLRQERQRHQADLEIVMRVYFEKPRTTVGWKGLINDPYLDQSFRIDEGLRMARQLLIEINRLGLPAGSEFLDVISPQYIGDLMRGVRLAHAPPKARCTENWPRVCRPQLALKMAPMATYASPPMPFRPRAGRTTSCRCTRADRWPLCALRAIQTAT